MAPSLAAGAGVRLYWTEWLFPVNLTPLLRPTITLASSLYAPPQDGRRRRHIPLSYLLSL
ncbi:hypothetical protein E2C01_031022 [Portunus trituberculatus]|uniref:Uncharacterized protein n=1 Tax=Portunus trituberculatus TaxID=210409 RepID=A0A5B7EWZ3_PORTR|nr:hypothetical protein [Portunus trituberculatus]